MNEDDLRIEKRSKLILKISITLFFLSLLQKCFCTEDGCGNFGEGMSLLLYGVLGFFTPPLGFMGFIWLANPLIIVAWFYYNKSFGISMIISCIAFIFAASFLLCHTIIEDEGGNPHRIVGYQLGYWLWLVSIITIPAGLLFRHYSYKRLNKSV